jgi:hypothetical protein
LAMHLAQGGQDHRQHVVGHQGQTKPEQGRLGITQGVDFRVKIRLDVLEGGLYQPAIIPLYSQIRLARRLIWRHY